MKKILTLFIALILTGCSAGGLSSSSAEISLPKQSSPEVSETKIETSDEKKWNFQHGQCIGTMKIRKRKLRT